MSSFAGGSNNRTNGFNRGRSFSNDSNEGGGGGGARSSRRGAAGDDFRNSTSPNNKSSFQDDPRLSRKASFDEENPQDFSPDAVDTTDKPRRPELQPYTPYDKFLLTIAIAAPFLILVFGELNRSQAWVLMNRWLVRDMDNQWEYNTWDVVNQSNATLYAITNRMQGLAGVYPAVSSASLSTAPYITLSQFEIYGQSIRQNDQVLFVSYSPYIINEENRTTWEEYSVANQGWVEQSFSFTDQSYVPVSILDYIWYYNAKGSVDRVPINAAPYAPSWQSSPPPQDARQIVNQDFTQNKDLAPLTAFINQADAPILSTPVNVDSVYGPDVVPGASTVVGTTSVLMLPVFGELSSDPSDVVGFVSGVVPWAAFFQDILPTKIVGFQIVVQSCGENNVPVNNTFELNGANVSFVGEGDLHDPQYDQFVVVSPFADFGIPPGVFDNSCPHTLYMFRTEEWTSLFTVAQRETTVLTVTIICTFVLIAIGFAVYDYFLRLRFKNRFNIANDVYFRENGALVESLFNENNKLARGGFDVSDPSGKVFQETTVVFADIVGLEEWSSVRDPSQVFALLEALYGAFDAIAERSDVYKVDSFGDNYVAVCGAPVLNRDHPFVMCQFARECLQESKEIFRDLSTRFGKDTKDLSMRFGINSGPVTASIVQGDAREGPRLQLFGDTVSTANYIKNIGSKNMIHLTEQTANLLISSGRRNLVVERTDRKRGAIRTYWLLTLESERGSRTTQRNSRATAVTNFDIDDSTTEGVEVFDTPRQNLLLESTRNIRESRSSFTSRDRSRERNQDRSRERSLSRSRNVDFDSPVGIRRTNAEDQTFQFVQYNSETLVELLKQVVGRRQGSQRRRSSQLSLDNAARNIGNGVIVIEEAVDVISFPDSDPRFVRNNGTTFRKAQLSPEVIEQMYSYVAVIAGLYRDNAFHNFEHASQTSAILSKMLSRVEATRTDDTSSDDFDRGQSSRTFDFAYAIAADPLTKFTMMLAALIHDVDHRGVPNTVLSREEPTLAAAYQGRSIHEQNALELAWNVLLSEGFEDLRACIYTDIKELQLFRQVLVNSVIATDVFDPELRALRRDRYKRAFAGVNGFRETVNDINRKATVAVEHLVQASDIGATMQSWSLYTKWNDKLFEEAWDAYRSGRTSRDPSITWYQDEIDFFDKYSIPLAKKLNNCGVFGVAGDEYLNFAEENRRRWVARGREIVALYVETYGRN